MTLAVVDSSVALSWCFADEASAESDRQLDYVRDHGALVPGLWFLEVANVLLQAEKRGRISGADVLLRLELISSLPIMVDQNGVGLAWGPVLEMARAEGLTVYDAAYLELAARRGLALFSRDRALVAAATRRGVVVSL
ncbi:MAG: type II toxin-antitoxin system VapC family toxin [Acidocella sp.]|nr:type II toxin-antitoxin system VapC family toxin [Acidocella sp.]